MVTRFERTPIRRTVGHNLSSGSIALAERTIGFDHQEAHALRQGNWKAIYSKRLPHDLKCELYNLAEDRCELNDLAEKEPERIKQMAADWEVWARRVGVIWEPKSTKAKGE